MCMRIHSRPSVCDYFGCKIICLQRSSCCSNGPHTGGSDLPQSTLRYREVRGSLGSSSPRVQSCAASHGMHVDVVAFAVTALAALQAEFKHNAAGYCASNVNPLLWWRHRIDTLPVQLYYAPFCLWLACCWRCLRRARLLSVCLLPNLIEGRERLGADRADMLLQIQHLLRRSAFMYPRLCDAMKGLHGKAE